MKRIIDLSQEIYEKMPSFPGYPEVKINEHGSVAGPLGANIGKYRWNAVSLLITDHHGTHVDAPFHLDPNGKKIHEMPVEAFVTEAVVLDLTHRTSSEISVEDLSASLEKSGESIAPGDAVLLHTGWDKWWNTKEYMSKHPWLSEKSVKWLLEKRIGLLGIDAPDTDLKIPGQRHGHVILLADAGIPIVENLCNLDKIRKSRVTFMALPLKIRGATGSPVRAVAFDE